MFNLPARFEPQYGSIVLTMMLAGLERQRAARVKASEAAFVAAGGREGGHMITHFRLGLIAVAWILVQAVLVADVIYRVSQSSM